MNNIYSYQPASNQLASGPLGPIQHDAAGNRSSDRGGNRVFEYNDAGRLFNVYEGGQLIATYVYNAQGQRTQKITPTETIVYHYDLAGNLLSETSETGTALRDYVFMNNVPVAQIDKVGSSDSVSFLHSDHLGTPRRATNADGDVVSSTSYTTGTVTGIDYKTGATNLLINDHEVPISSVIRIEERENTEES